VNFDYKNFITGYLGIPLYLGMILGYKLVRKSKGWTSVSADLFTGKDVIDREEEEFLAEKEARGREKGGEKFYDRFVAWLF